MIRLPSTRSLPRFSFCFVCTLVATVLALALMSSQGVLSA